MGHQVTPPGMHLCQLPYADDVRKIQVDNHSVYVTPGQSNHLFSFSFSNRPALELTRIASTGSQDDPNMIPEQPIIQSMKRVTRAVFDPKPLDPKCYPNPGAFSLPPAPPFTGLLQSAPLLFATN